MDLRTSVSRTEDLSSVLLTQSVNQVSLKAFIQARIDLGMSDQSGHNIRDYLSRPVFVRRSPYKEVVQPHLPVRLPCYDFTPVINPTFGILLPQGVGVTTSGVTNFHGVTGGVYKTRERIHRSSADLRLLAIPSSRRRVAAYDLN